MAGRQRVARYEERGKAKAKAQSWRFFEARRSYLETAVSFLALSIQILYNPRREMARQSPLYRCTFTFGFE